MAAVSGVVLLSSSEPANAIQVAAGAEHACAVTASGAAMCWGFNRWGQLGDGSTVDRPTAAGVTGLSGGVVAIVGGAAHSCALLATGGVKCWGSNVHGQLGNGSFQGLFDPPASIPVDVVGLTGGVAAITAGGLHTCALTDAGAVKCWGLNDHGRLGDGTTTSRAAPTDVVGLESGVAAVSAGGSHTCALTTTGSVACWGENFEGQIGDGTHTARLVPVAVMGLGDGAIAVGAGFEHTCAVTASGGVQCWGSNSNGQLGDGSGSDRPTPVDVSGMDGVIGVGAGHGHTCALTSQGGAKCWGRNSSGQLGDGTRTVRPTPTDVTGLASGVAGLAAGVFHSCAATTQGRVKCWGESERGQIGNGVRAVRTSPVEVGGLTEGVATVSTGGGHTCVVTTSGAAKCVGLNSNGQLGDGTTSDRSGPVLVAGLETGVAALAAGERHTCALTTGGGVKCWGSGGTTGDGTLAERWSPVAVSGLDSGIAAIAAGALHSCALTTDGGVKCWGFGGDGQLGDGSDEARLEPVEVVGLTSGVVAIAAGNSHSCAVTSVGTVKCWGGIDEFGAVPVDVEGIEEAIVRVSAGGYHSCAVSETGGLICWGDDFYGQLGNGPGATGPEPAVVTGLSTGVVAVSAGQLHTCAVTAAGLVKCWGANAFGQLGDSTTTPREAPVDVASPGSVADLVAGGADIHGHTCARTIESGMACWGWNLYGQLANGEAASSLVPRDVLGLDAPGVSCGNATLDSGESCDDGNTSAGDCCSPTCALEPGAPDADADGICDGADVCPSAYNPDQRDSDTIVGGDLCDACPADPADRCVASKTGAVTINPDGGMLEVPDQSLLIDFPPGAVDSPTSVSATGGLTESGFGLKLLPDKTPLAFQLEPSGKTFDPPVALTFRWQDANDNCFVDNPAATCPVESRTECTTTRNPACDLPVREADLQIFRDGQVHPRAGTTCASDAIGCNREANEWTVAADSFSEWVVGEATCAVVKKRKLTLRQLGRPRGDETLRLRGQINLDVPLDPGPIDPVGHGLTLVVETAQGAVLYAARLVEAYDALTETGWKKRPSKQLWTYASRPGAAEDVTATVSVGGAKGQRVKLDVTVAGLRLATLKKKHLPLSAQVFLDGRCGNATFAGPAPAPVCALSVDQTALECR